jgi:exo-beta-1,3-glucanase (GH17 family)
MKIGIKILKSSKTPFILNLVNPIVLIVMAYMVLTSCGESKNEQTDQMQSQKKLTAQDILGNPDYPAISYGGYRSKTRDLQPTVEELKEDMKILSAMGIRLLRTYNVQKPHAPNVVKAISQLKKEDPNFEMYVMLGAWIDCKNAWTGEPVDHSIESDQNEAEIQRAVSLAKQYPDIIKIIAVGNEAMVKWATSYYVEPSIILKWVKYLQDLKNKGELPGDLWITSSDNFASWGGGDSEYHVEELNELIATVDFISMHTYPMHDTHYNPVFWGNLEQEAARSKEEKLQLLMKRAVEYAQSQYASVKDYMRSLGIDKPIHIGETGWASLDADNHHYGNKGSMATDEYKEALYYQMMRAWTDAEGISCFYFEAFDEPWKDPHNARGSENFFGLFTVDGQAKYVVWELVDQGVFEGLGRAGNPITKTYNGNKATLLENVLLPPIRKDLEYAQ